MQTHIEETRRLRHDFRHHLTAVSEMLEHGHYEDALNFLREYRTEVSDMPKQFCSSAAVNAVPHHYESVFRTEGITPSFDIRITDASSVNDIDFCVLLGNLLENALHGCRQLKDESPEIELKINQNTPHIIVLQIRNPYDGKIRKENNRVLSTRHSEPAQGLRSVQLIAEKYRGEVCITSENRLFTVQVLLNV